MMITRNRLRIAAKNDLTGVQRLARFLGIDVAGMAPWHAADAVYTYLRRRGWAG